VNYKERRKARQAREREEEAQWRSRYQPSFLTSVNTNQPMVVQLPTTIANNLNHYPLPFDLEGRVPQSRWARPRYGKPVGR
jgi:hypothetical protein